LLHQAAVAYDRAFNPEGVKRQIMAILAEPSRVTLLNQLRVPTLVVHGTADPLLPVMHGVHLAAHIRGSQLKLIPGWPIVFRRRSRRRCWRRCCRTCKRIAKTLRIGRRSSRWRAATCCS
jgi:acetyl esterase/lipase